MRYRRFFFLLSLLLFVHYLHVEAITKYLSPLDFGLQDAVNGKERYEVLLKCHQQALLEGKLVSYKGVYSLFLEIPVKATGIPLAEDTDFCGATIIVKNQSHDMSLFTMERQLLPKSLTAQQIDSGDMSTSVSLARGLYLVVIENKNPWVKERIGDGYPHFRNDVSLVST